MSEQERPRATTLAMQRSRAKGLARFVLVALADYVNHRRADLLAWPSAGTLAECCGASRPKVSEALRTLRELGEITDTGGKKDRVTIYELTVCRDDWTAPVVSPQGTLRPTKCHHREQDDQASKRRNVTVGDSVVSPQGTHSVTHGDTNPKEPEKEPEEESSSRASARPAPKIDLPPQPSAPQLALIAEQDLPPDLAEEAIGDYNEICARIRNRLPKAMSPQPCAKITPPRKVRVAAALRTLGGREEWRDALRKMAFDPFLNGSAGRSNGHTTWRVTLDWLTTDNPKYGDQPPIIEISEKDNAPRDAIEAAVATGQLSARSAERERAAERALASVSDW